MCMYIYIYIYREREILCISILTGGVRPALAELAELGAAGQGGASHY